MFETQCLRTTEDPAEKAAIKANITILQTERREQTQRLAKASDITLRLIGPAPGTIVSTPPAQNPIQTPRITVSNTNSPIISTPSAQLPVQTPCITVSSTDNPITPLIPPGFFPANPAPPNFSFTMATPTPTAKLATATKRSKLVHPLEMP